MNQTYKIDGALYAKMLHSAAVNLRNNAITVNELNVFPVPDGDTGENMSRTIEGGAAAVGDEKSIGEVAAKSARGMLLAARGNSGVILSQFFGGARKGFDGVVEAGVKELKAAFALGVKQSYAAVQKPTEGTMLTVMREATERATSVDDNASVEEYFGVFIEEMYDSLDRTPELLPVLKEAGVIDSGGAGFTYIIEGMLAAVKGEPVTVKVENADAKPTGGVVRNRFERRAPKKERKKFACVTVADGDGLIEQFRSLGADYVIDGKQTMNPSTNDFITAFDAVNADVIFVMPNNSNIILAANQAAELYDKSRVVVIGSKTLAEGYAAMSMLDYSPNDADEIKSAFEEAISGVTTGLVSYSIRDCKLGGRDIKKGDFLGLADKTPISNGKSEAAVACELLDKIVTDDTAVVMAIRGKNADPKSIGAIAEYMQKNKSAEFYDFDGGQDVYSFIFVVE